MLRYILFVLSLSPLMTFAQAKDSKEFSGDDIPKSHLPVPFGKICSLDVVVVRGEDVKKKFYKGTYLLKVESVNGKKITEPILIPFQDKTGQLPGDHFELYKSEHKQQPGIIEESEIRKLEMNYVGIRCSIVAFETGQFIGFPEGYFDYQPIQSGTSFHFEHSLVVISINSKRVINN